jgi:predicted Zn-ribbon and HTH transcriptional regulator
MNVIVCSECGFAWNPDVLKECPNCPRRKQSNDIEIAKMMNRYQIGGS